MKKFIYILILASLLFTQQSFSAGIWSSKGNFSTLLNEMLLSNWAQGGENQISLIGLFNYNLKYVSVDTNFIWENIADVGYGFLTSENYSFRKNEDKIDLVSKMGYRAIKDYYYSMFVNFKTQFDKGYKYPNDSDVVSRFFAPAYLIAGIGIDFKPRSNLSVSFSPLSGRMTFVNNEELANAGAYGVTPAKYDAEGNILEKGKTFRFDFGVGTTINYTFEPMKNIKVNTKLDLFNNYTDPDVNNRRNIDINSENMIHFKVNDYISANIFLHFIYDQDIPIPIYKKINGGKTQVGVGPRLQIKENMGIGFNYAL